MAELTDTQIATAVARGDALRQSEPCAHSVRFDAATSRLILDLRNGCSYIFPTALVQELQGASPDALAGALIDGDGFNLHIPALAADLYIPALVAGIFGTRSWMASALARTAGRSKTPAKAAAARANGAKGGRPRKQA